MLLSAGGFLPQGVYDAGAAFISPTWFEQLSTSAASATGSGALALEQSTEKIQWKNETLDIYTDEWIVQLDREALAGINSVSEAAGLFTGGDFSFEVVGGLGLGGQFLLSTSGTSVEEVDAWLESSSAVAYFEPNAILPLERLPNDASFSQLWGLHNTGQPISGTYGTPDADIDAPEAWDIATGSASIVVGVIDTGVDYTHPDLAANIWTNPGEIAGNGIDDDGNGFVDDVHGYDFINNDGDPMDDNSHGTHCSGTIAGVGNDGNGVAGVNWDSSIMALKFLSGGGWGSLSDAVRAVNYATMMRTIYGVNIRVTSNSWGGGGYSQSMYDAIAANGQAGMMFIAAAGNSSSNNDVSPHYPSNYTHDNVISVAATDNRDNLAYFSSYGATTVDLAAPGVNVYSTVSGGGYAYYSGTSMATPHVSGVAALAWSVDPSATVAEIRAALLGGVDAKASLSGKVATGGRLNARGTLELLGMNVAGSSPAEGSVVSSQITDFTIDFSQNYDSGSVQASNLTVNGIAANSFTLVDGNTIRFRFNVSPISSNGPQTMQIAEGAIRDTDGGSVNAWQATFYYDQVAMAVTSTDPSQDEVLASSPTYITLNFNEPVGAGSVGTNDLVLSSGTVTAATLVDADTVRYTVNISTEEGQVTYTIGAGALTDSYGTPYQGHTGSFVVDDPTIICYTSTDTPRQLIDYGTIYSTLHIPDDVAILDLNVELDITHTWDDDLNVYLIAPNGTTIELFTNVGDWDDNFIQTVLDDEAATPITGGSAPFTGRFQPEGLLSDADGMSTAGTWQLRINDDYWWDTGTLNSWALQVKINAPPQLEAIQNQTFNHTTDSLTVSLVASDPEGEELTYSAETSSQAYELDQELGLYADEARLSNGYYENFFGHGEKHLLGDGGTGYFILPNGEFYRWGGSIAASTLVATLQTAYHADPVLLHEAAPPENVPVTLSLDQQNQTLTIDPADGYSGSFDVKVTASDGPNSSEQSFHVSVTNQAPELAAIADQAMPHTADSLTIPLVGSDPDGDAIAYTAEIFSQAYELDQELGLSADEARLSNGYYENFFGHGEKHVLGDGGTGYFILPNGEFYRWGGSIAASTLVATLDTAYHTDPVLLHEAAPPENIPVTLSLDQQNQTLTIDPAAGYTGSFDVKVTASDGPNSSEQSFHVSVTNQSPELAAIADQTMSYQADQLQIALQVDNPDGDTLSYTVTAYDLQGNLAYELDQQLGLYADEARLSNGYYENFFGYGEKHLLGDGGTGYFILPNGEFYRWGGSIESSSLVATLHPSYHADPVTLYEAQSGEVPITAWVSGSTLTVDPPAGFTGGIQVTVAVSDGTASDTESFVTHVVNQAPTLEAIADQTMAHTVDSLTIALVGSDPDGDAIAYTAEIFSQAYELDQELGLYADEGRLSNGYYENFFGHGEKHVLGDGGTGYFIQPNGEFYRWGGSIETSTLLTTLDTSYHADPATLHEAAPPEIVPVTLSLDQQNQTLTIDPAEGYSGSFEVKVTASDGPNSSEQSFHVSVTNTASALAEVNVQTTANQVDQLPIRLGVDSADGDTLSSTVGKASPTGNLAAVDAFFALQRSDELLIMQQARRIVEAMVSNGRLADIIPGDNLKLSPGVDASAPMTTSDSSVVGRLDLTTARCLPRERWTGHLRYALGQEHTETRDGQSPGARRLLDNKAAFSVDGPDTIEFWHRHSLETEVLDEIFKLLGNLGATALPLLSS